MKNKKIRRILLALAVVLIAVVSYFLLPELVNSNGFEGFGGGKFGSSGAGGSW